MNSRHIFSSASLPEQLSHRERFNLWRDMHYAQVATVEVGISDLPFEATLDATAIGPLTFAKMSGTINRVTRTPHSIRLAPPETYTFVMNLGASDIAGNYGATDIAMHTGSAFLDASQPQQFAGGDKNIWANLVLPRKLLDDTFAGIEDRQGRLIPHDNEAMGLLRNYLAMLGAAELPSTPSLLDHIDVTP